MDRRYELKLKVRERNKADLDGLFLTYLSASLPFPTFSLNFVYSQLTIRWRDMGRSA